MRIPILALSMMLLAQCAQADGLTDIGHLLETARLQGRAWGILGGEVAERMQAMGIDKPVEVHVTRLQRLRDPECARLKTEFLQRDVIMPGESSARDRHASFEMNWCEGGRPPSSAEGAQPVTDPQAQRGADEMSRPRATRKTKEARR